MTFLSTWMHKLVKPSNERLTNDFYMYDDKLLIHLGPALGLYWYFLLDFHFLSVFCKRTTPVEFDALLL